MSMNEQFALELFDNGGVVLNLETGAYFALDQTAARAFRAILSTRSLDDATSLISDELKFSSTIASRTINEVIRTICQAHPRNLGREDLVYERKSPGYVLRDGPVVVVEVDDRGENIRFVQSHRFRLGDYIRSVTPKLLALQGATVLHASAVSIANRVLAFSGASGSGKTTTANAIASCNGAIISEDLLFLTIVGDSVHLIPSGEPLVRRWQGEIERRLNESPSQGASCLELMEIVSQATVGLSEIGFLAVDRRTGDHFLRERLSGPSAVGLLMDNIFLGGDDPARWREHLRRARRLAEAIPTVRLTAPLGLSSLATAASFYNTISAS